MEIITLHKRKYEWKVIRYLNNTPENRTYTSIESIELIDNEYYRAEVNYIDHFISGSVADSGIYFIQKDEI